MVTPEELRTARAALGELWGLGRPLKMSELGRAIGLTGNDPGQSIRDYERGATRISGPISFLVRLYLNGILPPDGLSIIKPD